MCKRFSDIAVFIGHRNGNSGGFPHKWAVIRRLLQKLPKNETKKEQFLKESARVLLLGVLR
jgi:hypothetical protein